MFLGHHHDDNLETFVLRKVAGSNFEGLNSIKVLSNYQNILIFRPFLHFTKKEILIFAKKNNVKWIEDPSNYNMLYSRSKIRSVIYENLKIKKIVNRKYQFISSLYNDYIEMINHYMSRAIICVKYSSIKIDRLFFIQLPAEISYKILAISVNYVHKRNQTIRYTKLQSICSDLANKIVKIRSQNTFFVSINREILIFPSKINISDNIVF